MVVEEERKRKNQGEKKVEGLNEDRVLWLFER